MIVIINYIFYHLYKISIDNRFQLLICIIDNGYQLYISSDENGYQLDIYVVDNNYQLRGVIFWYCILVENDFQYQIYWFSITYHYLLIIVISYVGLFIDSGYQL